jgi:hypothetical protein
MDKMLVVVDNMVAGDGHLRLHATAGGDSGKAATAAVRVVSDAS